MEVLVRKALEDDIGKILEMNLLLFKNDYGFDKTLDLNWTFSDKGREYFLEKLSNRASCLLVAEIEGKIVGYLAGGMHETAPYRIQIPMAELENMLVSEGFRSKGIGKRLVEHFILWCTENKIRRVSVTASSENDEAVKFYQNLGFEKYNLVLEKELDGE